MIGFFVTFFVTVLILAPFFIGKPPTSYRYHDDIGEDEP